MGQDIAMNTWIHRRIEGMAINVYDEVGFKTEKDRENAINFWTAGYKSGYHISLSCVQEILEGYNLSPELMKLAMDKFRDKMLLMP